MVVSREKKQSKNLGVLSLILSFYMKKSYEMTNNAYLTQTVLWYSYPLLTQLSK